MDQTSYSSYGIRVGDNVLWKGPGGAEGRVRAVDYAAGIAFIEAHGWDNWEDIDDLFVIMPASYLNERTNT